MDNIQKAELTDIINKMKQGNPPATEGEIAKVIQSFGSYDDELDMSNTTTIIDKSEGQVVDAYLDSPDHPGLAVEKAGYMFGDAVNFVRPDGERIYVDLQNDLENERKKLDELNTWYGENEEKASLGLWGTLGVANPGGYSVHHRKPMEDVNTSLSKMFSEGGNNYRVEPTAVGYTLTSDTGDDIKFNKWSDLQKHLWDNVTEKELSMLREADLDEADAVIKESKEVEAKRYSELTEDDVMSHWVREEGARNRLESKIEDLNLSDEDQALFDKRLAYDDYANEEVEKASRGTFGWVAEMAGKRSPINRYSLEGRFHTLRNETDGYSEEGLDKIKSLLQTLNLPLSDKEKFNKVKGQMADDFGSKWVQAKLKSHPNYRGIQAALDAETSSENMKPQFQAHKDKFKNLEDSAKADIKKIDARTRDILGSINRSKSNGSDIGYTTTEINGKHIITVTGTDKGLVKRYQDQINKQQSLYNNVLSEYKQEHGNVVDKYDTWRAKAGDYAKVAGISNREMDTFTLMGEDLLGGFEQMALGMPAAFGSEAAMDGLDALQAESESLAIDLGYDEAWELGLGETGSYIGRSISKQTANVAVAVAASSLGMPPVAVEASVGTIFGLGAGGQKRQQLRTASRMAEQAKLDMVELEALKDSMDPEEYAEQMAQLKKIEAVGDLSRTQIESIVWGTAAIEGVVTAKLGTLPNSRAMAAAFGGKPHGFNPLLTRSQRIGDFLWKFGKGVGHEIAEEEIILFGSEILEGTINREHDISFAEWDETLVQAVLLAGPMNGPSGVYSSVTQHMMGKEYREVYDDVIKVDARLSRELKDPNLTDAEREKVQAEWVENLARLGIEGSGLEVDAMVTGPDGLRELAAIAFSLNRLYIEAGVKHTDSQADKDRKIEDHIAKLEKKSKTEAQSFKDRHDRVNRDKAKIHAATEAKFGEIPALEEGGIIEQIYGPEGLKIALEMDSGRFKKLSNREKLIAVHEKIKKDFLDSGVAAAKRDIRVKKMVESMVYDEVDDDGNKLEGGKEGYFKRHNKKRRTSKQVKREQELYEAWATQQNSRQVESITLNKDVALIAPPSLTEADIKSFDDIVDSKGEVIETAQQQLEDFINKQDTDDQNKKDIIDGFRKGEVNGTIIDGKYIVLDAVQARKNLAEGKLLQATAILHEYSHFLDNITMKDGEMVQMAENLNESLESNPILKLLHDAIVERGSNILDSDGNPEYNPDLDFKEQSDKAKEEYVKYAEEMLLQRRFWRQLSEAKKAGGGIVNTLKRFTGGDFNFNSDGAALHYIVEYGQSWLRGEDSKLVERKKKAFVPRKDSKTKAPTEKRPRRADKHFKRDFKALKEAATPTEKLTAISKILNSIYQGGVLTAKEQALLDKTLADLKAEGYTLRHSPGDKVMSGDHVNTNDTGKHGENTERIVTRVVKPTILKDGALFQKGEVDTKIQEIGTQDSKGDTKFSKSLKDSTKKIVAKNNEIYQRIVDAAKAKGVKVSKDLVTQEMKDELVENNLARAAALSNKAARVARNLTLDDDLKIDNASDWLQEYSLKLAELANTWDPSKNDSFGAYMNQLLPKKYSGILEALKSDLETSSMDSNEATRARAEAIAVEDDVAPRSDTRRKKTNVLKIGNVEGKADIIKDAVEVNPGDTFKEVSDNNTGRVAEIIFDVPADKITDPKKNLTYAKRIVNGIPEASEAGNIQSFYIAPQTVEKLLKILPEESVSSDTADINEIGENIDVDREVLGRGLGLSNRVLNSFYEKTNKRSKGLKSQPFIWKLKPEFKNPTPRTIAKVQEDLGITPRGELNNYNRDIGQLLKGVAKFQAQQTALSTAQRILTEQRAPKKQIASVTAAQSKVAFSKNISEIGKFMRQNLAMDDARVRDMLLVKNKLAPTFKITKSEDIEAYTDMLKRDVFPLLPYEAWFGPRKGTILTTSKAFNLSSKDPLWAEIQVAVQTLKTDKSIKYGKPIKGVDASKMWSLRNKYAPLFSTPEKARENIKNGEIADFNEQVGLIHKALWKRISKSIKKNKNSASGIATYLGLTANDTGHWHKLGAQFEGFSTRLTKRKKDKKGKDQKTRVEYEHAMPATQAYLYLLNAAINHNESFDYTYGKIIENYKLIALDKAMDDRLRDARTKSGKSLMTNMTDGWNPETGFWWERYFNDIAYMQDGGIDPSSIEGLDGRTFAEILNINAQGVNPALAFLQGADKKSKDSKIVGKAFKASRSLRKIDIIKADATFDTNWRRAGEHMLEFLRMDRKDAPIESRFLYDTRIKEIQKALDVFKEISHFTENPENIFSHVKGPLTWTNMCKAMIKFLKAERIDAPVESRFLHDKNIDIIKEAMKLPKEITYFTNSEFKEYRGSESAENDINTAISGVNPDGYSGVRFSKSHRAEYESRLLKKNPNIKTAKEAKKHVDELFKWLDSWDFYKDLEDFEGNIKETIYNARTKKKSKFEKLALHYMVHNKLRMPEDSYKVVLAEKLAEAKKIDPFSFKNPNDIIEKYGGKVSEKNLDPDKVDAFSNKRELANGITIYDVDNSSATTTVPGRFYKVFPGQQAVRDIVNGHFGKKSNPWCIVQAVDGKLTDTASEYWDQYGSKQIIFKDGKLIGMRTESLDTALTDAGVIEFWSRDNVKYNEIPGNNYVDKQGRTVYGSFDAVTGKKLDVIYGATKGSIESGKVEAWSVMEGEVVIFGKEVEYSEGLFLETVERYKDGKLHGISEEHVNPADLAFDDYASSIGTIKEYNKGEFVGSRVDYGDGQGLRPMQYGGIHERGALLQDVGPNEIAFSKSAKGISVLDFDDTLATTKSGVKARIPNPDGTPKPGRKVIFMAGGAGSGKGNVISKLGLEEAGYKIVNSDISLEWLKKNHGLPENQTDYTAEQRSQLSKLTWEARKIAKRKQGKFAGNGDGIVVDGTGGSVKAMQAQVQAFKDKGYDVSMVFVETSLEVAKQRNADRKERSLKEFILIKNHEQVQGNKEAFKELFGENFNEISTDNIGLEDLLPKRFKNKVDNFTSSYENRRLDAEEFAREGAEIKEMGGEFDFSEFDRVIDGKTAPLFDKAMKLSEKFGTDDMFILTARSPNSAKAIKEFLDAQGLKIPLKNITGLGQSEASAKANWIAEKVGEGYNDFYFADDAMQNVKAVKDMLDQFDVKGKVQQAKIKFSRTAPKKMSEIIDQGAADLDSDLNIILEETKNVDRRKRFSPAKARKRGKNKGRFKFFVPPSADDFAGLMYAFMGKGKQGEQHHEFFKKNLFDPFSKGIRSLNQVKQNVASDITQLRKAMPDVKKKLSKKIAGTEYTYEDAIRVHAWDAAGFDIPGLSNTDKKALIEAIENDAQLKAFAQGFKSISDTPGEVVEPGNDWLGGTINSDLSEILEKARATHLQQWIDNKDIIFNEANLNKIEAVYGAKFREALEDSLWRMEHGGTKSRGKDRLLNNWMTWIHGSVGATMFFNARSAILQQLSNVNFLNWHDNNPIKAAKAFANQKQYWTDFAMIFNSPWLKQRRSGIATDVNATELLSAMKDSKNPMKTAIAYLLRLGFTPTQIGDSLAIATGGSTMYRNRVNTYVEQGMSKTEAEVKAFEDMMEVAEETQQSTREDKISQQQASPLGKFILAFQNVTMQYNRIMKKAALDLVNGRGDPKANISKIIYYGAIQNMLFYGLQQALFAAMFSDDDDDQLTEDKKVKLANGMLDSVLRGSGIHGAVIATVKNVIMKFMKEKEKMDDDKFFTDPDWANVLVEGLNVSPPIGIKARKIHSALKTWEYNDDIIRHMDKTDIDNPMWEGIFNVTEAVTNAPLHRIHNKTMNIRESLDADNETWKRVAMFMGWSRWSFGIRNQDVIDARGEVKVIKAKEKKDEASKAFIKDQEKERDKGQKNIKCAAATRSGNRCGKKVLSGGNYCTIHVSVPTRKDGKKTQCTHVKGDGKRCKMKTTNKSGKCYYHD